MGNTPSIESAEGKEGDDKRVVDTAAGGALEQAWLVFAVGEFLPWQQRADIPVVAIWARDLTRESSYHRWLCGLLAEENNVYCPGLLSGHTWPSMFASLWSVRHLFVHVEEGGSDAVEDTDVELSGVRLRPTEPARDEELGAKAEAGGSAQAPSHSRCHIGVCARFRPSGGMTAPDDEDAHHGPVDPAASFHLPLHQRVQLIKFRDGVDSKAALATLATEGNLFKGQHAPHKSTKRKEVDTEMVDDGGSRVGGGGGGGGGDDPDIVWIGQARKAAAGTVGGEEEDKENAIPDRGEEGKGEDDDGTSHHPLERRDPGSVQYAHVSSVDGTTGQVITVAPAVGVRPFQLDHAFPAGTPQSVVYDEAARHLVTDFLNGFNATILVYGQTGSGKTHTMFHPPTRPGAVAGASVEPFAFADGQMHQGVVPRACREVLSAVEARRRRGVECSLSVSYVEVFGSVVSDLLRGGEAVGHNKVSAQRYVMEGEVTEPVHSLEDIEAALRRGDAQKRRAATAMNVRSSRAHSLFVLSLRMRHPVTDVAVTSQLFLADLGGSEQVKKSRVHEGVMDAHHGFVIGEHMREAIYINLGLLSLKQCIEALNKGHRYVPYQNSKLTMLLSPALGGDSKATVIVCASMDPTHASETLNTLRFGEKCSRVENLAAQKISGVASIIEAIDEEINQLEADIKRKERWEQREEIRKDTLLEAGTLEAAQAAKHGGELVRVGVVVGAEAERERLEVLIRRRVRLTGGDAELKLAEAGFGGQYGGKVSELGGNARVRFGERDGTGLLIKGKKIAEWQP